MFQPIVQCTFIHRAELCQFFPIILLQNWVTQPYCKVDEKEKKTTTEPTVIKKDSKYYCYAGFWHTNGALFVLFFSLLANSSCYNFHQAHSLYAIFTRVNHIDAINCFEYLQLWLCRSLFLSLFSTLFLYLAHCHGRIKQKRKRIIII